MFFKFDIVILFVILQGSIYARRQYTRNDLLKLREETRNMFQHAYQGYLTYASDYDELRPLTCDGVDTWGSYSLTLIDALDTLAVMGNYSEFRRVVNILVDKVNFDNDINVSVFETNIRIVGGLLSAHLMSRRAGVELEPGWPCNGPLLRMAEDVARRLLPAFDTKTGMPYGTVNLKYGVPKGETSVTCTAGVGTFIVEFGALSRLTGDPIYEEVALNALYALWKHKSPIGLFGNHVDVQTGRWTAQDAGIGAAVDSYYEYLVKGSIMLNRPDLLEMFHEGRKSIDKYLKRDDWYMWVSMNKGQVTLPVFQSLEAYWPGVLSLIGDITPAMKSIHNYHAVWMQYGFLPEFYNIPSSEAGANRENYPLRPELVESAMYLYRATKDPFLLEIGEDMLQSIQSSAKTPCGYATIKNVRDHQQENRMESFFLAETTKYLFLLFDADNFIHNDGREGIVFDTPNGQCVIEAGGYIFNTEAHPIDPSALKCCYDLPKEDIFGNFNIDDYNGDVLLKKERKVISTAFECSNTEVLQNTTNISIDLELVEVGKSAQVTAEEVVAAFSEIKERNISDASNDSDEYDVDDILDIYHDGIGSIEDFMQNRTVMRKWINDSMILGQIEMKARVTLYELYELWQRNTANYDLVVALGLDQVNNSKHEETREVLRLYMQIVRAYKGGLELNLSVKHEPIIRTMFSIQNRYEGYMSNETAMIAFSLSFTISVRTKHFELSEVLKEFLAYRFKLRDALPTKTTQLNVILFQSTTDVATLRKRILDAFEKLESIMEENSTSKDSKNNDDLFIVQKENESGSGVGTIDSILDDKNIIGPQGPSNAHFSKRSSKYFDNPDETAVNTSLLLNFVQSIIESTMPRKPTFDSQLFLQGIRAEALYSNATHNYELLTCSAQKFLQRYTYRGEFF